MSTFEKCLIGIGVRNCCAWLDSCQYHTIRIISCEKNVVSLICIVGAYE